MPCQITLSFTAPSSITTLSFPSPQLCYRLASTAPWVLYDKQTLTVQDSTAMLYLSLHLDVLLSRFILISRDFEIALAAALAVSVNRLTITNRQAKSTARRSIGAAASTSSYVVAMVQVVVCCRGPKVTGDGGTDGFQDCNCPEAGIPPLDDVYTLASKLIGKKVYDILIINGTTVTWAESKALAISAASLFKAPFVLQGLFLRFHQVFFFENNALS